MEEDLTWLSFENISMYSFMYDEYVLVFLEDMYIKTRDLLVTIDHLVTQHTKTLFMGFDAYEHEVKVENVLMTSNCSNNNSLFLVTFIYNQNSYKCHNCFLKL